MYQVGDAVRLSFRVIDPALSLVDADVTVSVVQPDGTAAEVGEPGRESVGTYSVDFVAAQPGRHVVQWVATGAADRTQTDVLNIVSASAPVAIISLEQMREHLNIPEGEHVEDDELRRFIDAASLVVEDYTGEIIARRVVVEDVYAPAGRLLLRPPVASVVSMTSLDGATTFDPSSVIVDGFTGVASSSATGWVRVSYLAGMPVVPEHYQTATAIICAHLWNTQRVPSMGSAPSFGGDTAPVSGRGYLIPNQAAQLLGGRAPNRP
jgi:hypothetical protein